MKLSLCVRTHLLPTHSLSKPTTRPPLKRTKTSTPLHTSALRTNRFCMHVAIGRVSSREAVTSPSYAVNAPPELRRDGRDCSCHASSDGRWGGHELATDVDVVSCGGSVGPSMRARLTGWRLRGRGGRTGGPVDLRRAAPTHEGRGANARKSTIVVAFPPCFC